MRALHLDSILVTALLLAACGGGNGAHAGLGGESDSDGTGGEVGLGGAGGGGGGGGQGAPGGAAGGGSGCGDALPACEAGGTVALHTEEIFHLKTFLSASYELPGLVVEAEPGLLVVDGGVPDTRLALEYGGPTETHPPFAVGEVAQVEIDHYAGDIEPFYSSWLVRLRDEAGRLRWMGRTSHNGAPDWSGGGLQLVRDFEASCQVARPSSWEPDATWRAFGTMAQLDEGPAQWVGRGESVALEGSGRTGLLHVGTQERRVCPRSGGRGFFDTEQSWVLHFTEPGEEGAACTADADCGDGAYCERGAGSCSSAGHCAPRPASCDSYVQRTCGCDGVVYQTPCHANQAGTDLALAGPASCEGHFRCGAEWCAADEACMRMDPDDGSLPRCYPLVGSPMPEGCDPAAPDCSCFDLGSSYCTCSVDEQGNARVLCSQ